MPAGVDESEILKELETFGASVSDDDVLLKMKELCVRYRQDADDLVSAWVAFASTRGVDTNPTLDNLNQLEREEFIKKSTKLARSTVSSSVSLLPPMYNAETIDNAGVLMDCFETPKRNNSIRKITDSQNSPGSIFSPSSYSPASAKYTGRGGKGDVLCSFGDQSSVDWTKICKTCVQVSVQDEKNGLQTSYQYMFEKLRDRSGVLNDMIEDMAHILQEKHNFKDCAPVRITHLDEVTVVGRIGCDSNGKLNATSVVLEGSLESSSGQIVAVDLSCLPQYSLFPGQIIATKAVNTEGTRLILKSVLEAEPPKFPETLPKFGPDPMDILVAAGPFTTSDSFSFEPLLDLMNYVQKHKPNVLILIGPFIDSKHESVQKGSLNETYEEIFKNQISLLIDNLHGQSTRLVLVPSLRDIHHHGIYPTPPFDKDNKMKEANVFCAPDPCILNLDGLTVGITSVDVIFHLGKDEISHPPALSDRLGRLTSHLITQHSFYPLYPPSENVNISYEHMEMYGRITVRPHILVTPSDLRCFVKDIHGCCCINPERLAKGLCGGSFARIRVKPCSEKQNPGSIIDSINVDIVRI